MFVTISIVHGYFSSRQNDENSRGENPYAQVNGGYAEAGPPSANGTDAAARQQMSAAQHQAAAAPPVNHSVVDKSKKKKKGKNEEKRGDQSGAQQNIPEYAIVDKSQKKKKVPDDTYAEVDKSKKSKKVYRWLAPRFSLVL